MSNNDIMIDICLATYNGSQWINDFLNSLDAQTYTNWRLVVSDDDSQDGTLDLITSHFQSNPDKLSIVQRGRTKQGVVQNFQDAIKTSNAKYVLLADQDDIWLPEKITGLYARMLKNEQGNKVPALIFSDLEVVNEQLLTINNSWWDLASVKPDSARSFKGVLCQNIVPGCSMMLNRSLIEIALPFPKGVIMHDWWLLLVCAAFGKVDYCHEKFVRYRRHAGAHTYFNGGGVMANLLRQYTDYEIYRKQYTATILQAQSFEVMFGESMQKLATLHPNRRVLHDYIAASKAGWWRKRWLWIKNGIHLTSMMRTAKFYIVI